jgi:hypothetical protein
MERTVLGPIFPPHTYQSTAPKPRSARFGVIAVERESERVRIVAEPDWDLVSWQLLIPMLVHPVKVMAIEAMLRLKRPLSATELEKVASGTVLNNVFSYHLARLVDSGVLEVVGEKKVKKGPGGKKERFFYLADQHQWAARILRLADPRDPLAEMAAAAVATSSALEGQVGLHR